MNEIDYHKIGEEFEYNGRKFVAVDVCADCDLEKVCTSGVLMGCNHTEREDHCDVIYIEVNSRKKLARAIVAFLAVLLLALFISTVFIMILDRDYILSMLLAVALLFVVVDVIVERKYKG